MNDHPLRIIIYTCLPLVPAAIALYYNYILLFLGLGIFGPGIVGVCYMLYYERKATRRSHDI